ncbi:MAG: DUF2934 domain-containing protein [Pseudomonadota bacterium]
MTPSPNPTGDTSGIKKAHKPRPPLHYTRRKSPGVDNQAVASRAARINKACQSDQLRRMIAEAAYYKAEKRGFSPDGQVADWLEAEKEIMAMLSQ